MNPITPATAAVVPSTDPTEMDVESNYTQIIAALNAAHPERNDIDVNAYINYLRLTGGPGSVGSVSVPSTAGEFEDQQNALINAVPGSVTGSTADDTATPVQLNYLPPNMSSAAITALYTSIFPVMATATPAGMIGNIPLVNWYAQYNTSTTAQQALMPLPPPYDPIPKGVTNDGFTIYDNLTGGTPAPAPSVFGPAFAAVEMATGLSQTTIMGAIAGVVLLAALLWPRSKKT